MSQDENVVNFDEEKERIRQMLMGNAVDISSQINSNPKLDEMNEKHAFINSCGGRPMVLCHTYSAALGKKIPEFRSPDAIQIQYSNQSVQVDQKSVPLGSWWIQHSNRREYDTVVFDPDQPKEFKGCLNLYEGLSIEPKQGTWVKTLRHLYMILNNSDRAKFEYTIKWLAWCLQNPGQRAEVVLIFKGKQGAGKGFIFSQFVKLFGNHGLHISNRKHLTGAFNGHMATCVFMFADEAYYPGDKEVEGALNQMISEEKIGIERKGRDLVIGKNCLHIGMATNAEWVIPATGDARRYYINEVDNRYAKNEAPDKVREKYFNELWGEMRNGGLEAMAFDLLKMDLSGWHPRFNVPITSEYRKQTMMGSDRETKFLYQFLSEGEFPGELLSDGVIYKTTSAGLRSKFLKQNKNYDKLRDMRVKVLMKSIGCVKRKTTHATLWEFQSLEECKRRFTEANPGFIFEELTDSWVIVGEDF